MGQFCKNFEKKTPRKRIYVMLHLQTSQGWTCVCRGLRVGPLYPFSEQKTMLLNCFKLILFALISIHDLKCNQKSMLYQRKKKRKTATTTV